MIGQIPPTRYDLQFTVARIPVRVHPVFWLTSAFLAWVPGHLELVFVRILCIFVAVLVHELGHAVVTRSFGWFPEIVLYFFGGYATSRRYSTWKDIAVSIAGPGAGFALYFLIKTAGVALFKNVEIQNELIYVVLYDALRFSLFINFVWNVMNLVPVLPLDGGRISQEFLCWASPRKGMEISMKVSVAASGAVALWALYCLQQKQGLLGLDPMFLAIMFGYLCYQGVQQLQNYRRGPW